MKRTKTIISAAVIAAAAVVTGFLAMGAKSNLTASADTICEHEYVVTTVDADCTHSGYTLYYCKLCGYEYTDNYTEKTGHNYVSELVSVTGESGYIEYTCSNCGDKYIETCLSKSGHSYKATTTEATCISYGYTLYECKTCGDKYITDYVSPTGHVYEDITVAATAESKGYIKHVCKNCSYSYISDITPNEDKTKGESETDTADNQEHTHEYVLNFSINETDRLLSLKYVCDCGAENTGEVTATFVSGNGDIQTFTPNDVGEVDYSGLTGDYLLTVTNADGEILMEWDITDGETNTDDPDNSETENPDGNDTEEETEKQNSGGGVGIIIFIVLLLVAAGGLVGYKIYKKKKTNNKNN